jgi:hypothetical protein
MGDLIDREEVKRVVENVLELYGVGKDSLIAHCLRNEIDNIKAEVGGNVK